MLLSMTGHGLATEQDRGMHVMVEARSINNRFFKTIVHAEIGPDLQASVDEAIRGVVRRGTVTVRIRVDRQDDPDRYRINETALRAFREQLARLAPDQDVPLATLLTLPGAVVEPGFDVADERLPGLVIRALENALRQLNEMRTREGNSMLTSLRENLLQLRQWLAEVERLAPRVVESFAQRTKDRIAQLLQKYDLSAQPSDIVREVGLFAERADIAEEIVRLRSHVRQFESTLDASESNGRKLDFVIQEMLREANTIGSKASDVEIAGRVVDMKTAIERMRELVQNVE